MKEEVEKLLKVSFMRVIKYPTWLANVMPIKKSNGCVLTIDYTNLNKTSQKTIVYS